MKFKLSRCVFKYFLLFPIFLGGQILVAEDDSDQESAWDKDEPGQEQEDDSDETGFSSDWENAESEDEYDADSDESKLGGEDGEAASMAEGQPLGADATADGETNEASLAPNEETGSPTSEENAASDEETDAKLEESDINEAQTAEDGDNVSTAGSQTLGDDASPDLVTDAATKDVRRAENNVPSEIVNTANAKPEVAKETPSAGTGDLSGADEL